MVGKANDSDQAIINWAKEYKFIVFTNDLDFGAILAASSADSPSVFQLIVYQLKPWTRLT